MVNNPPFNAGDVGSIPGRGTKIPHAEGQLSPHVCVRARTLESARATTREKPVRRNRRPRTPQLRPDAVK